VPPKFRIPACDSILVAVTRNPEFRFARSDEIGDIARLVAHSFPGPTRTREWWQDQLAAPVYGGGAGTLLVGFDGARPAAALQVHPLRQWVAGTALATAGIGSVAVSPTHRRRRLGADLVSAALRAARERGDTASALYPFRTAFYQQLGYGTSGSVVQMLVPPASLPDSPERQAVELLDSERARQDGLALYGRWARTQNGQLERNSRLWQQLTTPHDSVLVGHRNEAGELDGYALALYRTDLPVTQRYLEVEELVWTTPAARRGLLAWLASLGDQWPYVMIRSLPAHGLLNVVREPVLPPGSAPNWRLWSPAATLLGGTMFRLLDVEAGWRQRAVNAAPVFRCTVEVTDAQLKENTGRWQLAFEDGATAVKPDGTAACNLRLDISTLSRLYTGALAPTDAFAAGLLECDVPEELPALDGLLSLPQPWTFDRF
jgi:predicted acetyltransferase